MQTTIRKWGNSLALRIPKSVALASKIKEGCTVRLNTDDDRLIVTSEDTRGFRLDELLAKVTKKNMHEEVKSSAAVGKEVW